MLFTITTTARQADDLSFLLHKHPARVQVFELKFGKVHVFYPEVSETRCTAAMLLDVDPIALVRRHRGGSGGTLGTYVNDRPYVASSFLSVAISQVFGTALAGHCKDLPDRVDEAMPFEVNIAVLPSRGAETVLRRLFEPLGYQIKATPYALDERFPQWGASRYFTVNLKGTCRLQALLSHLYVLVPVLDDEKHYYVGEDEVEKLLRRGESWLPSHPERDLITERYLKYQRSLVREALARLQEDAAVPDATAEKHAAAEEALEAPVRLNTLRLEAVLETLKQCSARRVLDLGCGEGKLLVMLMKDSYFEKLVGMDVSAQALETAAKRLHLDRHPIRRERVSLLHGALTYRDDRLHGYDAATLVEVIEHLDSPRLRALGHVVFEHARPGCVIVTTPNREYNARFESLPAGNFRHPDHRFEWGRSEFHTWAEYVAAQFGYTARFVPIGEADEALGPPTQMAVFEQLHD